jgi:hypothetical protein
MASEPTTITGAPAPECPFCCSAEAFVSERRVATAGCSAFWVECEACGARGPISEYKNGALIRWSNAQRVFITETPRSEE